MNPPTHSLIIPATPGAPVACDMTTAPDTPDERIAEYGRLFAHALVARERTDNSVVFTFAAKPGVWEWITDLVPREAACCPFASYEIERRDDQIRWSTSTEAGPTAQAILDQFYAAPDLVAAGMDGFLAGLADNGVHVTRPEPGRFTVEE